MKYYRNFLTICPSSPADDHDLTANDFNAEFFQGFTAMTKTSSRTRSYSTSTQGTQQLSPLMFKMSSQQHGNTLPPIGSTSPCSVRFAVSSMVIQRPVMATPRSSFTSCLVTSVHPGLQCNDSTQTQTRRKTVPLARQNARLTRHEMFASRRQAQTKHSPRRKMTPLRWSQS